MAAHRSTQFDSRGVALSPYKTDALQDFETTLIQFHSYFGDPTEALSHKSNDHKKVCWWSHGTGWRVNGSIVKYKALVI